MKVTGRGISTIKSVCGGTKLSRSTAQAVCSELRRIWLWYLKVESDDDTISKGGDSLEMFCRTMATDVFSKRCQPMRTVLPDLRLCLEELPAILETSMTEAEALSSNMLAYVDLTRHFLQGRSSYMTDDNQFGLAPGGTNVGDRFVVFLGCDSAIVLRPSDSRYDGRVCHSVIGETYCHGFMQGEALLGPIPSTCRKVQCTDEETEREWIGFINESTDILQDEDPR
jgi:hypothetical protein